MAFGFGFGFPFLTGGSGAASYSVNKSLRFRSSASAYLNRTFGTPTNNIKWTWSAWVKRGTLSVATNLLQGYVSASVRTALVLNSNDTIFFNPTVGGLSTTAVFRDPAAWYHIICVYDSANATAGDRLILYVNGTRQTLTGTDLTPSQVEYINSANDHYLASGRIGATFYPTDCELAEVNFIDGRAVPIAELGAYSTYNQWLPIAYAGIYGTNGFYLPFSATSATSYAGLFNGSTQYLTAAKNTLFEPAASQAWTVEAWVYPTSITDAQVYFYGSPAVATGNDIGIYIVLGNGSTYIGGGFYNGINQYTVNTSILAPLNTWTHIAVVSTGSVLTVYGNGVSGGSVSTSLAPNAPALATAKIGYYETATPRYFPGQISNVRFVKGTAVYTANFVPPTAALTAITNTSLLTLQSATVVDNSGNSLAITNVNTVVTSVQSPFLNPTVLTADSSGNANNWTPNNISLTAGSTYDSLTDVPTLTSTTVANYAVLNAVNPKGNSTVSNGNLTEVITTVTGAGRGTTIAVTSGKFYVEATAVGGGAMVTVVGITSPSASTYQLYLAGVGYYSNSGNKYISGVASAYGTAWSTAGTYVIGMALDVGAGTIQFYLNNVAQGSITLPTMPSDGWIFVADWESGAGSVTYNWNYGQQPFTYTAPSGFLPLNTYNI